MIIYLKYNFFRKPGLYGLVHKKIELINQDNCNSLNSIKILEVNFGNFIQNNSKWDKISIAKKSISGVD